MGVKDMLPALQLRHTLPDNEYFVCVAVDTQVNATQKNILEYGSNSNFSDADLLNAITSLLTKGILGTIKHHIPEKYTLLGL